MPDHTRKSYWTYQSYPNRSCTTCPPPLFSLLRYRVSGISSVPFEPLVDASIATCASFYQFHHHASPPSPRHSANFFTCLHPLFLPFGRSSVFGRLRRTPTPPKRSPTPLSPSNLPPNAGIRQRPPHLRASHLASYVRPLIERDQLKFRSASMLPRFLSSRFDQIG